VLNAPLVVAAARQVAARVEREAAAESDDDARIVALWRDVLARSPSPEEQAAAAAWLTDETQSDATDATNAAFTRWARLAQAVLATAEFQFVD